jgi:methanogenic corrinoid protein MtbC1
MPSVKWSTALIRKQATAGLLSPGLHGRVVVTNLFDTSSSFSGKSGQHYGSHRELRDDPCGERLDWSRGLEGLRREIGRSAPMSGPLLTKVIEREIIPRLFLSHCDLPEPQSNRDQGAKLAHLDSEGLTHLVLSSEPVDRVMQQVQDLLDSGISLQRIYLDLLAPIARRLGEFWEADRCSFIDMTIALSRLHWILRELGRRNGEGLHRAAAKPRIFLAPTPGEHHTFGLLMIEEFFLHAGWEMATQPAGSVTNILDTIATQHIDIVGFSVCCDEYFGPLTDLIKQVQAASINPNLKIMVGGSLFTEQPEYRAKVIGATVVVDGVNAVESAENLLPAAFRVGQIEQTT